MKNTHARLPCPAKPNTLSFVGIVYADEVTQASSVRAKSEVCAEGRLRQSMIRGPLKAIRRRIG